MIVQDLGRVNLPAPRPVRAREQGAEDGSADWSGKGGMVPRFRTPLEGGIAEVR